MLSSIVSSAYISSHTLSFQCPVYLGEIYLIIEVYLDLMKIISSLNCITFTMVGILTISVLVTSASQCLLQWNEWVASDSRVTVLIFDESKMPFVISWYCSKSHMGAGEEKEYTDMIILCERSTSKFSQKIFEVWIVWIIPLTCLPSPTISVQTLPSPQIYLNFPGLNMDLYDTWWDQF